MSLLNPTMLQQARNLAKSTFFHCPIVRKLPNGAKISYGKIEIGNQKLLERIVDFKKNGKPIRSCVRLPLEGDMPKGNIFNRNFAISIKNANGYATIGGVNTPLQFTAPKSVNKGVLSSDMFSHKGREFNLIHRNQETALADKITTTQQGKALFEAFMSNSPKTYNSVWRNIEKY